jgi:uncharacterized metal-binding protein
VELCREGKARLGCTAAIGAHVESFIKPNQSSERKVICIDGCGTRCASKTLEKAEINPAVCIVVTDLSIKKNMEMAYGDEDVKTVKKQIEKEL